MIAQDPNARPKVIALLETLTINCRINKHQHFDAAARNLFYNNFFGSSAIVINVILGSVLFVTVSNNLPEIAKWASGFMAMLAAVFSGIQTFFNFQRLFEGHRRIGNRYLELQRESQQLLASFEDQLTDLTQVLEEVEIINSKYTKITIDAESFPTSERDFQRSIKREDKKKHRASLKKV